jgi:hypothetical protein
MSRDTRKLLPLPLAIILCVAVAVVSLSLNYSGYQGIVDDRNYVETAFRWLDDPPVVGENHWQNRLPIVLGLATAFSVFGRADWVTGVPAALAYLALAGIVFVVIRRLFDTTTATVATILMLTCPVFAIYASIPMPMMPETLFAGGAVLLFLYVAEEKPARAAGLLFAIGVMLGLASLIRPYTLGPLVVFLVLFLRGYGIGRARYWWMAGGLVAVVAAEFAFYWIETGNPLNRIEVDSHALTTWSYHLVGGTFDGLPFFSWELMSRWVPDSPVPIHWTIDPYIGLLLAPPLGLTFWLALFCAMWMWIRRIRLPQPLGLLMLFGISWFVSVVYVFSARPHPRYYGLLVLAVCIFSAVVLCRAVLPFSRLAFGAAIAAFMASGWLLLDSRGQPFYVERTYLAALAETDEPVYADNKIIERSMVFVRPGDTGKIRESPAPSGALELAIGSPGCSAVGSGSVVRVFNRDTIVNWTLSHPSLVPLLPAALRKEVDRNRPPVLCIVRR